MVVSQNYGFVRNERTVSLTMLRICEENGTRGCTRDEGLRRAPRRRRLSALKRTGRRKRPLTDRGTGVGCMLLSVLIAYAVSASAERRASSIARGRVHDAASEFAIEPARVTCRTEDPAPAKDGAAGSAVATLVDYEAVGWGHGCGEQNGSTGPQVVTRSRANRRRIRGRSSSIETCTPSPGHQQQNQK